VICTPQSEGALNEPNRRLAAYAQEQGKRGSGDAL